MNTQVLSDKVLLDRYLLGERGAISQLIDRHSNRVRDYIRMVVKDRDLADDILQETLIKVVRVIDQGRYADTGKFLSWVLRIAHNQVIDYFRSQKSTKTKNESDAGYNVLGTLRFADSTVEDKLIAEQVAADVRRLVEHLPEEQREVVMLRYYSGLSFQEIADQTDVSINTALGRMRYALINLRKMIKENDIVLG
jgi:RNA polymerase sigma-70 factor (ECF subfamily)